ncbi:unnamed protein product [Aphanomyces euteiches]|uniref:Uncharacterized protein n=2 Tax=Aphanomyces euteiches TaxID=100861 RepID=A0A6G0WTW9_9STRA|nr:hypothetical protein Ae201684_011714 [Aphanomyces euteiches]KAH9097035.1 hypothetical protein Ae201684P_011764 [Aphanomyces euteiches]KAH9157187.1 hypothetical protein AeRB84_000956 [Aphanomyces euteiches]
MVRKKRKTVNYLVKTRGLASTNVPLPVDISDIDLPTTGAVKLDLATGSETPGHVELNLKQLYADLVDAPDTYAQLKVLQLFRSHLKVIVTAADTIRALPSDTQALFWTVAMDAFRFTFRLYTDPVTKDMRKTILPILTTFSIYDAHFPNLTGSESLGDVVVDEVARFLQDTVLNGPAKSVDDIVVVLDQILAMCEYPAAADALWALQTRHSPLFGSLIRYCGAQLRLLTAPIVVYHGKHDVPQKDANDDHDVPQPSEVVLASERCMALLRSLVITCTASQRTTPSLHLVRTPVHAPLAPAQLAAALQDIVRQCLVILETSVVHKDLLTTVGLSVALVLKLHLGDDATYVALMLAWLFDHADSPLMPHSTIARLSATAKLSMYRGLLNSVSDASFRLDFKGKTLVEILFETVLAHCVDASLNVRLYAFQVLDMYLRRLFQANVRLCAATTTALVDAVLLNWDHPAKKINQFMTPMFTHAVAMLGLDSSPDWTALLARLLAQPDQNRSKFIALGILLPRLSVADLLDRHPTFFPSLLASVENQDVVASAATLFVQVLDALRHHFVDNLAAWSAFWVPPVADALLSPNSGLGLRIATYVVPVLAKSEPTSLGLLVDAIRARDDSDVRLWALFELVKHASKTAKDPPTLPADEVKRGLVHRSGDIRMAAYDMLCASLKTTSLPDANDLQLVQFFLVSSSKSIPTPLRMKLIIGLKAMLLRIREASRKSCRRDPSADDSALQFPKWIQLFVVNCITPGATPQRLTMGLEILQLYTQIFDKTTAFHTAAVTKALLNAIISCWDRVRALAFAILETFPKPLPGYEDGLDSLFDWALTLCCSPRQRESDAGALFMRLLYKQHGHLKFLRADASAQACVDHVVAILKTRLDILASSERGEPPLIHGLLLALRFMLEDTPAVDNWQNTIQTMFELLWRAMHLALSVVGDATSGVGAQTLEASYAVVGEVLTTPQLRAKVDCRGHLVLDDPELADGDAEQRAVVGSWLAAREAAGVLAALVKSILRSSLQADADIQRAGDLLLNALFALKHGGAVATVSVAFEDVCKALLHHSDTHRALGQAPSKWCDQLLHRLEHAEQQFILRRSAGFASSFVALLRAEPRNAAATMLPHVVSTLLRLAGDANAAERVRVHSLNILKLVGQDGVLAEDVAVYVPAMLTVAVHGFESTSWAVRNSSMMLFAATTQRAIGDKQVADGAASVGVSANDVFTRCAGVDRFLLQHLGAQVYPLLLFLSRLRPGEDSDGVLPLETFIPLVLASADDSNIFHRRMAAHALAAIVRPENIAAVALSLLPPLDGPKYKNNQLHGSLLQLVALVDKTSDARVLVPLVDRFAGVFPSILALPCDTNRGVFLELCGIALGKLENAQELPLWRLMSRHCQDALTAETPAHSKPGRDLYLHNVAAFVVQLGASLKDPSAILPGLESVVFELRRTTTKEFYNRIDAFVATADVLPLVQVLTRQLLVETHPPTQTRQLLLLVCLAMAESTAWTHIAAATARIAALAVDSIDPVTTAPALELLSLIHRGQSSDVAAAPAAVVDVVVKQIVILSDENQPLLVRQAAAHALVHSRILATRASDPCADLAVDAWMAALDLLQDDELQVRETARQAAVDAIQWRFSALADPSEMIVLPHAVEFLASEFKASARLHEHVVAFVAKWTTVAPLLTESIGTDADVATCNLLCEKIFEAESGNFFKQTDLTLQLMTWHCVSTGVVAIPSVIDELDAALRVWQQAGDRQAWVGGTTFFPDVFPLLHNLIVVATAVLAQRQTCHDAIYTLATALLQFQAPNMHPLLHTALSTLAKAAHSPQTVSREVDLSALLYLAPFWTAQDAAAAASH